jgi:hypothetical protein
VLSACLANPGVCTAFLTWGFTDKATWLGTAKAPLPFDELYQPKPAYYSMLDLLNNTEVASDESDEDDSNDGDNNVDLTFYRTKAKGKCPKED